jgi:hypothetical protein
MNNLTLLTYTHSNCSDIHQIYFDSFERYFNEINHVVLVNSAINDDRITEVIYDEESDYYEQILLGLSKIETDYLIYSQEDYVLYDFVNKDLISKYVNLLDNDRDIMFLRLINAGLNGLEKDYDDEFIVIDEDNEYYFSTQITIWRKSDLERMFKLSKTKYISEEPKNSPFLKSLNGLGLCTKLKGDMVGNHFNSLIYPYTAVAILRGKWNFSEYGEILEKLLNKYNIDKNKRGLI